MKFVFGILVELNHRLLHKTLRRVNFKIDNSVITQ